MNCGRVLSQLAILENDNTSRKRFLHIRSIAELSAAMETYPVTLFPDRLADSNFELARELSRCSDLADGEIRMAYLIRGLNHLEAAKAFFSRDAHPGAWASIHILAGNIFVKLGGKNDEPDVLSREEALQAKSCFEEAAATFESMGEQSEAAGCGDAAKRLEQFIS